MPTESPHYDRFRPQSASDTSGASEAPGAAAAHLGSPQAGAAPSQSHHSHLPAASERQDIPFRTRAEQRTAAKKNPVGVPVWAVILIAITAGIAGSVLSPLLLDLERSRVATIPVNRDGVIVDRAPDSVSEIAANALPSVVYIEAFSADAGGTGSGFVFSEEGHILTNSHVIVNPANEEEIAATIWVIFQDGTRERAEVVGHTRDYDIAVIKIPPREGLIPLVLGNSDEVVVGDPVVAIGAPLGLSGTVTSGIISALNRPVTAGDRNAPAFINAIQTDAAINPGNSGGPLVNHAGEVIGINSAIAQSPGTSVATGSIGLGFAIPSNQVIRTAGQLIENGVATYPIIGVLLDRTYQGEGVQIVTAPVEDQLPITPGGPGDEAGLLPGDIILAIDGRPVTNNDELIVAIRAKAAGDTVTLTVRSAGREHEVEMVLVETEAR